MLYRFIKIPQEELFFIIVFALSVILSFLFGYAVFRYWQVEVCKMPMQVGDFGEKIVD